MKVSKIRIGLKARMVFVEITCALLILLFLYATFSKLLSPNALRHDMLNQPFPRWFSEILIWLIPSIEILLALLLIFEKARTIGLAGSFLLLFAFSVYSGLILMNFFPYVPCGCGGVIRHLSWPQHLAFNFFFTGIAFAALDIRRKLRRDNGVII